MEDEPLKAGKSGDAYDDLDHIHTFNLPKNVELLAEFRQVLDNKTAEDVYNPRCVFNYVLQKKSGSRNDESMNNFCILLLYG